MNLKNCICMFYIYQCLQQWSKCFTLKLMKNLCTSSSYEFAILNSVFVTVSKIKHNDYRIKKIYLYMYSDVWKILNGFLFLSNSYVNKYTKDVYSEKIVWNDLVWNKMIKANFLWNAQLVPHTLITCWIFFLSHE